MVHSHRGWGRPALNAPRPFRPDLLHERRRDHIGQQDRRNQHRPEDRLRPAERNVARDPDERQDCRQQRFQRQFQHFERGDTRRPDSERRRSCSAVA